MQDRRKIARSRTFFGGVIAFNQRSSTMNCLVRNFSAEGANVAFNNTVTVPDEFDLTIKRKERSYRGRIVWRRRDEAGIVFLNEDSPTAPIPLEWARRLRDSEAEKVALRNRIAQLSTAE